MHAYNKTYLYDAQILLANAFDYALVDCKLEPNFFATVFSQSKVAQEFERGNPGIIAGKAANELIEEILAPVLPDFSFPAPTFSQDRSPEYWAGWALCYYQWATAKSFRDIFLHISLERILQMYVIYHEMDISHFVDDLNELISKTSIDTKLKTIREARGLSQNKLASLSGVNKRSIQLYEQRVNDIDKAQAQALYKLSRALGCEIEDLLENPEE